MCVERLEGRLSQLKQEIEELNISQASETKSSAGDKYETAREMIDLERDKLGANLEETLKMLSFLGPLNPSKTRNRVEAGAIIKTTKGRFYMSVSLGSVEVDGEKIFVISAVSPIGQAMLGKETGDSFSMNGMSQTIEEIL